MKRVLFIITILFITTTALGQTYFRYGKCFNGYWDDRWEDGMNINYGSGIGYVMKGNYGELVIYSYSTYSGGRPSDYIAKIKVIGLNTNIDKKEKKRRKKNNEWYEYTGTIEYYSDKFNETKEKWLRHFPYVPDERGEGTIRRVASVRIKIAPYKKNPECYNIWLENGMGLGIQL